MGSKPDGGAWTVAVEAPDPDRRAPHSILSLQDCAVATSGDYRHWVEVQGRRLSHTMDPRRGAPLLASPASVTVVAPSCAAADAWATALMVLGPSKGAALARKVGIDALFLLRGEGALRIRTRSVSDRTLERAPTSRGGGMEHSTGDRLKTALLTVALGGLAGGLVLAYCERKTGPRV